MDSSTDGCIEGEAGIQAPTTFPLENWITSADPMMQSVELMAKTNATHGVADTDE